jgi:hypothetical protein
MSVLICSDEVGASLAPFAPLDVMTTSFNMERRVVENGSEADIHEPERVLLNNLGKWNVELVGS